MKNLKLKPNWWCNGGVVVALVYAPKPYARECKMIPLF